jgi:hypothetical protein
MTAAKLPATTARRKAAVMAYCIGAVPEQWSRPHAEATAGYHFQQGLRESMLREKVAPIGWNFRRVQPIGGVGASGQLRYRRPSALAQRSFLHGRGSVVSPGATPAGADPSAPRGVIDPHNAIESISARQTSAGRSKHHRAGSFFWDTQPRI